MLTRACIRKLIDILCRDDESLDALCIDYFPEIYKRFSIGMNRTQKVNILLFNIEGSLIIDALASMYGEQYRRAYASLADPIKPQTDWGNPREKIPENLAIRALRTIYADEIQDEISPPPPEVTEMAIRSVTTVQGHGRPGHAKLEQLIQERYSVPHRSANADKLFGKPFWQEEIDAFKSRLDALEIENQHLKALVAELSVENRAIHSQLRGTGTSQSPPSASEHTATRVITRLRAENQRLAQENSILAQENAQISARGSLSRGEKQFEIDIRIQLRQQAKDGEVDSKIIAAILGVSQNWPSGRACQANSIGRPTLEYKRNRHGEALTGKDGRFRYSLERVLVFVDALEEWVSLSEKTPSSLPLWSATDDRITTGRFLQLKSIVGQDGMPASFATAKRHLGPPIAFCISSAGQGYSLLYPAERLDRFKEQDAQRGPAPTP